MAKQTRAKTSPKAPKKENIQTEIPVEKIEKVEEVAVEEVVTYRQEFWSRQIFINGRIVTGEVLQNDKQEFLKECKKNGIQINYDDWFVKEDWRKRVFRKKGEKKVRR